VIIELSGGNVQNVYGPEGVKVVLVDWDNIAEGDEAVVYPTDSPALMSPATLKRVESAEKEQ
jgi:hypothetical protein